MRIVLISSRFYPFTGGVENVVLNLAKNLGRENQVLVVTSKMGKAQKSSDTFEGIEIKRIWLNLPRTLAGLCVFPLRFVTSLIKLVKTIREFKPAVINYHFPDDSSVYIYLATKILLRGWTSERSNLNEKKQLPLVLNIHGNDLQTFGQKPWYRFFLKKLVFGSRAIVVHSSYIKEELVKAFPQVEAKVQIIPNGVDEEFFKIATKEETPPIDSLPWRVPKSPPILFLGRLVPKKGVDVLLKAFASVKEELESDLVIVGDGEERKNLEELAEKLGIGGRVRFTGTKTGEPLFAEIRRAKFAVMPSRREPFGIVALELAASGKAIIASRTGGLKELLEDGKTALFFENENPNDLAERIVRLEKDSELRERLAKAAKLEAEKYRWEEIGKRYLDIYKNS